MSLFNFFKKGTKKETSENKTETSVFDDVSYSYTLEDYEAHKVICGQLTDIQKSSLLVVIGAFCKIFFSKETIHKVYSDSLLKNREVMLGLTYDAAKQLIQDSETLVPVLSTISNKKITDILLTDSKYLLRLLVHLTMVFNMDVKINHTALDYLYGVFIPLGYTKLDVYDPHNFI